MTTELVLRGARITVSDFNTRGQFNPDVAANADGFGIVWQGRNGETVSRDILGRLFDTNGTALTSSQPVNTTAAFGQYDPSTVATESGGAVAWEGALNEDETQYTVFFQAIGADGAPVGAESTVPIPSVGFRSDPAVAALDGGGFLMVWEREIEGQNWVQGQRFAADGAPTREIFSLAQSGLDDEDQPEIATLNNGQVVAVWAGGTYAVDFDNRIYGQFFNTDGELSGSPFQIDTTFGGGPGEPKIAALSDGGFVVVWTDGASGPDVYGRVFNADKTARGDEFQINSIATGYQTDPDVVGLDGGQFVVTWESDPIEGFWYDEVKARLFDSNGAPLSDELLVASGADHQADPTIAALDGTSVVITWETDDREDVEFGVFAQIVDVEVVGEVIVGTPGDDVLEGTAGADTMRGLEGNDTINAGDGTDTINGGDGDDTISGGDTSADRRDTIYAGAGNDSIDAGYGNDLVYGQDGNDTIAGGFGADELFGQNGDDVITGSAFSDLVFGGAGDDFVNGGFGFDRINGGTGADKFFHAAADGHGSDWLQDYTSAEGDVLVFGGTGASASDFVVRLAHTASAAGERSGDDDVQEAFVNFRGETLWALVDGGGEAQINIQIGAEVFDLLA